MIARGLLSVSHAKIAVAIGVSLAWLTLTAARAAEPGDTDGDGILTLGDVAWVYGEIADASTFGAPAPGSLDLYGADSGCISFVPQRGLEYWLFGEVAPNLMTEVLRRAVQDPLPNWYPVLDQNVSSPPLPADPRVRVRIADVTARGGADDSAQIVLELENEATITHFLLILESDQNVLRFGWGADSWSDDWWMSMAIIRRGVSLQAAGDVAVALGPGMSLISPGKLTVSFGFRRQDMRGPEVIPPGVHSIIINARLPLGTAPGRYGLRILPTSQVVLDDWTVIAPKIEGPGELTVEKHVQTGWDEGPVPIKVDLVKREVLGDIELRLVDVDGNAGDAAHFEGQAGEDVRVRVQLRTEVPLNELLCAVAFPQGKLFCNDENNPDRIENLFVNPEDGLPYDPIRSECHPFGYSWINYLLPGYSSNIQDQGNDLRYPGRILEYFKPLGKWTDLFEVTFQINEQALPGEEIPRLMPYPLPCSEAPDGPGTPAQYHSRAQFHPYSRNWVDCDNVAPPLRCRWTYPGLKLTGSKVIVLEGPPPPPPPDYEILLSLGNVSGQPGELVEVPILASASESLDLLRLALDIDPAVAALESVALVVKNSATFEPRTELVLRGEHPVFVVCYDEDTDDDGVLEHHCRTDTPFWVEFHDTEAEHSVLDLHSTFFGFPGTEPSLLATLRVRIAAEPAAGETFVRPTRLLLEDVQVPFVAETGGTLLKFNDTAGLSPGTIDGGKITVLGFQPRRFLRGDVNHDQKVDLSDAVAALGYLFLGGAAPTCLDAADTDDSGVVEITDPIFLLGALFLGAKSIPEPYPACGSDVTRDSLGCAEGCP